MMDVSPNYAGIIMGISNTIATIPGIICPVLISYIIGEKPTLLLVYNICIFYIVVENCIYHNFCCTSIWCFNLFMFC